MIGKMIFGQYNHTIDSKKRMFLPAKVREVMSENIILVASLSAPCIALYPEEEWEKFEAKLETLPEINGISTRRKIYSSLQVVQADAQGRILIPQMLCDYAHLDKNVVVIGVGHHAEIWNEELRAHEIEKENSPELLEKLSQLGF